MADLAPIAPDQQGQKCALFFADLAFGVLAQRLIELT